MRYTVILLACLLSALLSPSYAATLVASGILSFNGTAVTSHGDGNQVTLDSVGVCSPQQEWGLDSDGYIYQLSNKTLVLDVQNSNPNNGAAVIMWNKKPGLAPNQLWTLNSTGIISQLNGYFLRKSSTSSNVVNSNNNPPQMFQFTPKQQNCPTTCTSHGDPHFVAWNGMRFDFQSANTVLLANFTGNRLYSVQYPCAPGVTCNEGFVVHIMGTTETFQLTFQQAWHNKTMITLPIGTTSFSLVLNVTKISNTSYIIYVPGGMIEYAIYTWGYGNYVNLGATLTGPGYIGNSICMGPPTPQNPAHAFGSQFLVMNRNDTDYQYTRSNFSYNPNYVPSYPPYTPNDPALDQKAKNTCNQINSTTGPYAACQSLVASDFFWMSCYNDIIAMNDLAFAQGSMDTYAYLCTEAAGKNGTTITLPTSSATTMVVNANNTVRSGSTYTFTIVAKDINNRNRSMGGDNFTITSSGPSVLMFTIVDNGDGTYTVTTMFTMEGSYMIYVKLNNLSDISGSPINVTSIAVTSATTTGLVFVVASNQTSSFTIQARTSSGNNRTTGGDQFAVTFSGGNFQLVAVMDNNDGTYTITYIAYTTGTYTINVTYGGTPIACSPFTVIVR